MVVAGGVIGGGRWGSSLFGGTGSATRFNPALVGRAILQAAFPVAMTTLDRQGFGAGPLHVAAFDSTLDAPLHPARRTTSSPAPRRCRRGNSRATWPAETADLAARADVSGSTGETSAVLIVLGGVCT